MSDKTKGDKHKSGGKATKKSKKAKDQDPHKELPDEISNSESEGEGEVKLAHVGYIQVKAKGKFKAHYCVLIGGTFYWFKNNLDQTPAGKVELAAAKIDSKSDDKHPFTLTLSTSEGAFEGACSAPGDLETWLKMLKENSSLPPAEPPMRAGKKQSKSTAAKKAVATKLSTSKVGKGVIKKVINDETAALLVSIRRIIKKTSGPKKADEIEKNIIKLAVKSYLLIDRKKLQGDEFLVADKPLREAFELLIKCFNGRGRVDPKVLQGAFVRVEEMLKNAETVITNLLAPHLTPKNMFRISSTFGHLAHNDFLNQVFRDDTLEEDLEKLIDAMEYYTQFHY
mmetsp:Transcript_29357/g.32621  ORF Transcript_29357/g.32621 Transcript_29357/m.32621 type:complete len:339 (+) Transcript_29357:256-1272(+)